MEQQKKQKKRTNGLIQYNINQLLGTEFDFGLTKPELLLLEKKIKNLLDNQKLSDEEVRSRNKENQTWELFYPDGTSSLMTYDPIKFEKEKAKKILDKEKKIMEWHNLVVNGLVNGLSHTSRDGRLDDINFWRGRCNLFNEFSKCVLDIVTDQDSKYSEKQLKEIAKEGYK